MMNIGKIRKVEIWITSPTTSEDGWSKVKSFYFYELQTQKV